MAFKAYEWKILLRIVLLPLSFGLLGYLIVNNYHTASVILSPFLLYQLINIFSYQRKVYTELEQFTEAVHYRDFSRQFDPRFSPAELKPLRRSFNSITSAFKEISREKETQYHYLQHILEIVGTGIISYHITEGNISWMNESVKRMLNLPHLKNIHALERRDKALFGEIKTIAIGESKLISVYINKNPLKVLLSATAFTIGTDTYKLLTFQNVNDALEETEINAWTRLLSVMTHEIMNSIAPIASLANTLKSRLADHKPGNNPEPAYQEDLEIGLETIRNRSESLLKFADTYRNLSKINTLNLKKIYVRDLFENQHQLMMPTLRERNIDLEIILKDPELKVSADPNLLEQVLINLIVNAIEAVKARDKPKIALAAQLDNHGKCVIRVNDNGPGIPHELLDKIFIPFFSTRKNGSGIGLNLCKQIMMLHRGNIQVHTIEGTGTSFVLTF